MEAFTQKYTIVQLLEPMQEGDEYAPADWPLHVTIADVFRVSAAIAEVYAGLEALLAQQPPVTAIAAHDEYFGPHKETQVTILDMSPELVTLHHDIITMLRGFGAVFNTPQYIEAGWRGHVTVRPQARVNQGTLVQVAALTVIDLFPDQNPHRRRVLKTIPLRG